DVFESLCVAPELEEDPALVRDEAEDLRAEVRAVLTGELVRMRALVGRQLRELLHAGEVVERVLDLGLAREIAATAVRRFAGRFLNRNDVANASALRANLIERAVGNDATTRHDDRASACGLDLFEVVRGEQDGAIATDLLQVVQELGALVRVEVR